MAKRRLGSEINDGLRMPHYRNGRLLTAEDLNREQETLREKMALYGRGFAAGVVEGLRVSVAGKRRSLTVSAGIGLNADGDLIHLGREVTLPVEPIIPADPSVRLSPYFKPCDGGNGKDKPSPIVTGAYVLTAAPTAELQGTTPRRTPDGADTAPCANQWEVEGVTFSIIRLDAYDVPTGHYAPRNRNLLAHWFYGSDELMDLMLNPFNFNQAYTGYADLPSEDYTVCDLPLAAFYWQDGQARIQFLDEWACRRRVSHPYPATAWRANVSDQRQAEGEARFSQFQDQLEALQTANGTNTDNVQATRHFAYLPPVGFLPVNPFELVLDDVFNEMYRQLPERLLRIIEATGLNRQQIFERVETVLKSEYSNSTLFSIEQFFKDILPPVYYSVHEDVLIDRLQQSWWQKPISLPAPPDADNTIGEVIWTEQIRQAMTRPQDRRVLERVERIRRASLDHEREMREALHGLHATDEGEPTIRRIEDERVARIVDEEMIDREMPEEEMRVLDENREAIMREMRRDEMVGIEGRNVAPSAENMAEFTEGISAEMRAASESPAYVVADFKLYAADHVPLEAYIPDYEYAAPDDKEPEPIIDIFVVDKLLAPYRNLLRNQMKERIEEALGALINDNLEVFLGRNRYEMARAGVRDNYVLKAFIASALRNGQAKVAHLSQLRSRFTNATFYVAFVRYRPKHDVRPGEEHRMPGSLRD